MYICIFIYTFIYIFAALKMTMQDNNLPDYTNIKELLNLKEYNIKYIIGVTRQQLISWQDDQLIEDNRNTDRSWQKFSLLDILWMATILEMRDMGIPIKVRKLTREHLFSQTKNDKVQELTVLEWTAIQVITYATPIFLVIRNNGEIDCYNDMEYIYQLKKGNIKNHSVISLNEVIKNNIEVLFSEPNFSAFNGLSADEIQVMLILRTDNFQSIRITKKDGQIDLIEGTESIVDKERILDILKEHSYQNIELKQANGKIVSASRTFRTKLKNKKKEISSI